jgi:hypothetical protein
MQRTRATVSEMRQVCQKRPNSVDTTKHRTDAKKPTADVTLTIRINQRLANDRPIRHPAGTDFILHYREVSQGTNMNAAASFFAISLSVGQLAEPATLPIHIQNDFVKLDRLYSNVSIRSKEIAEDTVREYHALNAMRIGMEAFLDAPKSKLKQRGIFCDNNKYTFWIKEAKPDYWQLAAMHVDRDEIRNELKSRFADLSIGVRHVGNGLAVSELSNNRDVTIVRVAEQDIDGVPYVRIDGSQKYWYANDKEPSTIDFYCLVDPRNSHAVVKSEKTIQSKKRGLPKRVQVWHDYGERTIDGIKLPVRSTQKLFYTDNVESTVNNVHELLDFSKCRFAPDDFFLEKYGIPGPVALPTKSQNPTIIIVISFAIFFLATLFFFIRLRRK